MSFLDKPIIALGNKENPDYWTYRNAVEGMQIFGSNGSGKTSGPGRNFAIRYLEAGFGGLVLTVKPEERKDWVDYCLDTNRFKDLVIIEEGGNHFFNFLDYEAKVSAKNGLTANIVDLLKTVIRASETQDGSRSPDKFWDSALDLLLFNVIDLCKIANDTVTLKDIYDIVQALPKEKEDISDLENLLNRNLKGEELAAAKQKTNGNVFWKMMYVAGYNVHKKVSDWEATPEFTAKAAYYKKNLAEYYKAREENVPELRIFALIKEFFFNRYKFLADKTRSIIDFSFSSFLYRLLRDPFYTLFGSTPTNIRPEDCWQKEDGSFGKIILINLPTKQYQKVGRDIQIMLKYIFQRAMERREVPNASTIMPTFLWADEAQNFLHEHDAAFLATSRSKRVATVYLSQNLPNYYANMGGGEKAQFFVKSLLGTLGTKIFNANSDVETNKYASQLIGESFFKEIVTSQTTSEGKTQFTEQEQLKSMPIKRPEDFMRLATGGEANHYKVKAYMHVQGSLLANRHNYTSIQFDQNYKTKP